MEPLAMLTQPTSSNVFFKKDCSLKIRFWEEEACHQEHCGWCAAPFQHICIFSINWEMPNKTEANYHVYYQTLIKDGTANGATSNAYLTSSNVSFKTKCIIMKYRTGTLYNQKHAVLFKLSTSQTCPLCPQVDSTLHILSGCQQICK